MSNPVDLNAKNKGGVGSGVGPLLRSQLIMGDGRTFREHAEADGWRQNVIGPIRRRISVEEFESDMRSIRRTPDPTSSTSNRPDGSQG